MKNSALIRIFSFKRFLRLVMGLLLFSNCMLSSDLIDPDEAYVALVCYERVPDPIEDRFECGNGTMEYPFVIANLAQLMVLQSDNSLWDSSLWASGMFFDVVRNLDLDGIAWQPIGNVGTQFNGTFRGLRPNDQPVQISNLQINEPIENNIGFFGRVNGATIENVGMENVNIIGNEFLGGLVGASDTATINNCYAAGVIEGENSIGGLLGRGAVGTTKIDNSYSTVDVTARGNNIGGLVGRSRIGTNTIKNSYATGTVAGGKDNTGGLVGNNEGGTIENSYATGTVAGGKDNTGGLVGNNEGGGTIENSYATGTVTGDRDNTGGLVGDNKGGGTIENSYATGTVTGDRDNTGGLVGWNEGGVAIENSYATGTVTGATRNVVMMIDVATGGLVGRNEGTIENSYATGTATGDGITGTSDHIGGLVGNNKDAGAAIENSYATGDVTYTYTGTGASTLGGLVGYNQGGAAIENSYATGDVTYTGTSTPGGLVGNNLGTITGTNYFVETEGGPDGIGLGTACTVCSRQGAPGAPISLENTLDETLDAGGSPAGLDWDSASDANGDPIWNNLNENGFPCIATITFGRGGCPP